MIFLLQRFISQQNKSTHEPWTLHSALSACIIWKRIFEEKYYPNTLECHGQWRVKLRRSSKMQQPSTIVIFFLHTKIRRKNWITMPPLYCTIRYKSVLLNSFFTLVALQSFRLAWFVSFYMKFVNFYWYLATIDL